MRMSLQDTVRLRFISSEYSSDAFSITTYGGTAGWSRSFTRNITLNFDAGAKVLEGDLIGVSLASTVAPVGNLSLQWLDNETSMLLAYNLDIMPSVQVGARPLLNDLVTFTVTQQTTIPDLLVVASANYGHSSPYGSKPASTAVTDATFTTWGGVAGLTYRLTPKTFLGVTFSYANYDGEIGTTGYQFVREVVQMSLTHAFY
jgi:hypothetical protein